jgi:hypothetical protein
MWRRWNRAGLGWQLRIVNGYGYIGVMSGTPQEDPPPTHSNPPTQGSTLPREKGSVRVRSRDYARMSTAELAALFPTLLEESAEAFVPTMVSERSISDVNTRLGLCAERWTGRRTRAMAMLSGAKTLRPG